MTISPNNGQSLNASVCDVDSLDMQIIELLQTDGRLSYSLIARQIDVPEATIRYRVKRLLEEKIIKIGAFLNTGKLTYENIAFIELDVIPAFYDNLLEELINNEQISYMASYTGSLNIMLEYIYKNNDELLTFLKKLRAQEGVLKLDSRIILKIYKAQYPAKVKKDYDAT